MSNLTNMRQVTSILTQDQFAWFEAERAKRGATRSELIRSLVQNAINVENAMKLSLSELKYQVRS